METLILFCGFFGAWLLVAGPILQAALELQEQDIARDKFRAARQKMHDSPGVSTWWWLVPPVKIYLEQRNQRKYQLELYNSLTQSERENLTTFMNKARGWWFVAGGAFLIALKETYELADHLEWPLWLYISIIGGMLFLSFFNTVVVLKRTYSAKTN